jgi:MORN repeat
VDGLKEGYGRLTWADGSMYCGGFKRNKRHGRGVQTDFDGTVVHCGLWKDDCPFDEPSGPSSCSDKSNSNTTDSNIDETSADGPNESLNTTMESTESSVLPPPTENKSIISDEDKSSTASY